MDIVERILELLQAKGIKQKELTDYLGINESAIANWKKGKVKSYMRYISEIATFLEVSVDYLLGPDTCDVVSSGSNNNIQNGNNNNIAITNCDYDINEKKLIEKFRELDYEEQIKLMAEVIDRVKEKKD